MAHIPREISRYVYFFVKEENGKVFGTLQSLKYKTSPIPSGRLEIPFLSTFSCKEKWVVHTIEEFIQNFCGCRGNQSVGTIDSEDEEEDDYQTIVLEPENEEDGEREKSQSDKIDLEIDKDIPVPIIID